jgi:hypothetical protein
MIIKHILTILRMGGCVANNKLYDVDGYDCGRVTREQMAMLAVQDAIKRVTWQDGYKYVWSNDV